MGGEEDVRRERRKSFRGCGGGCGLTKTYGVSGRKFMLSAVGRHARVTEGEVQREGSRRGGAPDGRHALVVSVRTAGRYW